MRPWTKDGARLVGAVRGTLANGPLNRVVVVCALLPLSTRYTSAVAFCRIQVSRDLKAHRGEIDINRLGHSKQILVDEVLKAIDG